MVEVKIRKFGDSLGVILPKELLMRLNRGDGGKSFLVKTLGGEHRLTPSYPAFATKMEKAEDIMGRYDTPCANSRSE